MLSQQLNENIVLDFVGAIFNAIAKQRSKVIRRVAEQDPEFQKIVADLAASRARLKHWAAEKAKTDPRFARSLKTFQDLGFAD